jgi:PIN domain nuclease of toxin-antitoxin system
MSDFVLDTHACVFALVAPNRLGAAARRGLRQIEAGRATAWVPAAVAAEIVLLRELGRIGIGLAELKTAMEKAPSLRFLPLDLAQVNEFAAHSGVRDPFDRLIISACRTVGAKLMTRDRFLHDSGLVQAVWK